MQHSIIMTCYNSAQYVLAAVNSVLEQMNNQDELIIVEDAAIDTNMAATLSSIKDSRCKLILRRQNGGIAAARNDGIRIAVGSYISFLDSDDLWSIDRHSNVNTIISNQNKPDIISGRVQHFYTPEMPDHDQVKYKLPEVKDGVLAGSVTIKSELVKKAGLFCETFKAGEFIDFFSRIQLLSNNWVRSEKIFLQRRIHYNNFTQGEVKNGRDYLAVIRKHLDRNKITT